MEEEAAPLPPQPRTYHLSGRLHFSAHRDDRETLAQIRANPQTFFFSSVVPEEYMPFCGDFGPNNIADVMSFCAEVHKWLHEPLIADRKLVFYVDAGPEAVTNCVFLLVCHLMLDHGLSPDEAMARFEPVIRDGLPVLAYRDAAFGTSVFDLSVLSCLRGLHNAVSLGWLSTDTFDVGSYLSLLEQATHDITRVSPRFIAFAAPRDHLDQHESQAGRATAAHTDIFGAMGVTDVVRLSAGGLYDDDDFTRAGFRHHALDCSGSQVPSPNDVRRFLDIVGAAGAGAVAVHCVSGLGRTGTLIACHMIKNDGFTASEAIGYLRVMRSGSIIGAQQTYLARIEACEWDGNTPLLGPEIGHDGPSGSARRAAPVGPAADRFRSF